MIDKIQDFLTQDPKRVIDVYSDLVGTLGSRLNSEKLAEYGGIKSYLIKLQRSQPELDFVHIQQSVPNGSSANRAQYKKYDDPKLVRFEKQKDSSLGGENVAGKVAAQVAAPPVAFNNPTQQMHQPLDYGNQGMNGGMMAVHMKAFNHDKLEKELDKAEKRYDKLEKKYERLDDDHRTSKSEIANFTKQSELDRRLIELSVKKFDTSEFIEKSTPVIMELVGAMKSRVAQPSGIVEAAVGGLAGVEGYSANKQELLKMVLSDRFTDEDCFNFTAIFTAVKTNPDYLKELTLLNDLHSIHKNIS